MQIDVLQIQVQLCCTLNQWFLHFEAVGGVCMPTNECSKGGELSATGHLSNSTPNHDHTHPTCLQIRQTLPPTVLLCSPNKRLFVPKVLWVPLDLSEYRFRDIDPRAYPTWYSTAVLYFVMWASSDRLHLVLGLSVGLDLYLYEILLFGWWTVRTYVLYSINQGQSNTDDDHWYLYIHTQICE